MNRDRSRQPADDAPLARNEFFQRVEQSEADSDSSWNEADEEVLDPADVDEIEDIESDDPDSDDDWDLQDEEPDESADTRAGVIAVSAGGVLAATGAALAALSTAMPATGASIAQALGPSGVTPFGLCIAGLVVAATGLLRRQGVLRGQEQDARLDALDQAVRTVSVSGSRPEDGDVIGGDVDRVLVAIQRQDEKINNLTRATKLYGKPLIDISNQVAEVANQVQDTSAASEQVKQAVAEAVETFAHELEARISDAIQATRDAREAASVKAEEILSAARATSTGVEEMHTEILDRVGQGQAGTQQAITEGLEGVHEAQASTQQAVAEGLDSLRQLIGASGDDTGSENGLDELEQSLSTIHREMQSLATTMARLESRPSAPVAAAAPAAPAAPATSASASPAPAATSAVGGGGGGGDEGLASRIAGPRQGSSKNVLGAIAKLKSMRS